MNNQPLILAIDTSCDETSVAVLRGFRILSNLLPSQAAMHREWGGVVPSLAKLAHQEKIDGVVTRALKLSGVQIENIDVFAVTYGPGLAIALEIGIKKAKELATKYNKPLIAVNHMEGHLFSAFAERKSQKANLADQQEVDPAFNAGSGSLPALGVLVSGGHTEFILVNGYGSYKLLGETLDDACGEAYDKCGRLLGLGYPAGPAITKFAKERRKSVNVEFKNDMQSYVATLTHSSSRSLVEQGMTKQYSLPVPMANSKDFNMSYSGLKSAFSRLVSENEMTKEFVMDMCVLFEAVALKQVTLKIQQILKTHSVKEIWLGGGVVASPRLRSEVRKVFKGKVRFPHTKKLTGDNAAMIAVAANLKVQNYGFDHNPEKGVFLKDFEKIDRDPSLTLA